MSDSAAMTDQLVKYNSGKTRLSDAYQSIGKTAPSVSNFLNKDRYQVIETKDLIKTDCLACPLLKFRLMKNASPADPLGFTSPTNCPNKPCVSINDQNNIEISTMRDTTYTFYLEAYYPIVNP
jgi:hypothetical protein